MVLHDAPAPAMRPRPSSFSTRAAVVGTIACLLVGFGAPYSTLVLKGSSMDYDFSTAAALFLLFILTAFANNAVARLRRSWALTPGECTTVYIMMIVACAVQTMGLSGQLMSIITAPYYYATPENDWDKLLQPHLNPWLAPESEEAVRFFYEGLPAGRLAPWSAWIRPLSAWGPFLMVLYFVMICSMVILRRQWVERERLIYPLTVLPLEMVAEGDGTRTAPLYRNPVMWLGFAVPLVFATLQGLHHYYPTVPSPTTHWQISMFRQTQSMHFRVSFPMVGFFYLVEQQTAFSLWFFNVLFFIIRGILNVLKIGMTENLGVYGAPSPVFAHLGMGAFLVLVFGGLRTARGHLIEVVASAIGRGEPGADRGEILSYRAAFWGLLAGLVFMTVWLNWSGMPLYVAVLFLITAMALFVGLTRIVAESGMAEAVAPTIAPGVIVSALGAPAVGERGLMSLAMSYVWCSDMRTFVMASAANGLKLAESTTGNRRRLFWLMILALLASAPLSIYLTMRWAYQTGGVTMNNWFFAGGPLAPLKWVQVHFMSPKGPNIPGLALTAGGATLMAFLAAMRQRFLWWPFHPLGFALAPVWIMDQQWMTILLSWTLKTTIMRYGGVKMYRRARAFFLGLILGQFCANGFWLIIDQFAGGTGNMIFWI